MFNETENELLKLVLTPKREPVTQSVPGWTRTHIEPAMPDSDRAAQVAGSPAAGLMAICSWRSIPARQPATRVDSTSTRRGAGGKSAAASADVYARFTPCPHHACSADLRLMRAQHDGDGPARPAAGQLDPLPRMLVDRECNFRSRMNLWLKSDKIVWNRFTTALRAYGLWLT